MLSIQNHHPIQPKLFVNDKIPKHLERKLIIQKTCKIALAIFTLGISYLVAYGIAEFKRKILCRALLPAAFKTEKERAADDLLKQQVLKKYLGSSLLTLQTKDRVNLEAMEFPLNSDKWMVRFCGNGEDFINAHEYAVQFAKDVGTNLLLFNYRGVGRSGKKPSGPKELILDGISAVQYVKDVKKCAEDDLLLKGFSLGGIIATATAVHYKKIKLYHERSPSSGALAVKYLFEGKWGALIAIAVKILKVNIDVAKLWRKIGDDRKLSSFHRYDGIVKYAASLYKYLKDHHKKTHPHHSQMKPNGKKGLKEEHKPKHIKIYGSLGIEDGAMVIRHYKDAVNFKPHNHVKNHVLPLKELDPQAYQAVVKECRKLLNIQSTRS